MPIFVWSTSAIQPQRPEAYFQVRSRSRRSSASASSATSPASIGSALIWIPSFQALQVGQHGLEILGGEAVGRHLISRFDGLGIDDPAAEVAAGVGQGGGGEGAAAGEMGEVGAELARRLRPLDVVADGAGGGLHHLAAVLQERVG